MVWVKSYKKWISLQLYYKNFLTINLQESQLSQKNWQFNGKGKDFLRKSEFPYKTRLSLKVAHAKDLFRPLICTIAQNWLYLTFSGDFSYHYIWWFGSVLGAVQCAVIYRTFFAQEEYLFPFVKNLYQQ